MTAEMGEMQSAADRGPATDTRTKRKKKRPTRNPITRGVSVPTDQMAQIALFRGKRRWGWMGPSRREVKGVRVQRIRLQSQAGRAGKSRGVEAPEINQTQRRRSIQRRARSQ